MADGNGLFLKLTDPNSDNNLAENWTAISGLVAVDELESDDGLLFYPNPVITELTLKADQRISRVQLFDIQGRLFQDHKWSAETATLDMSLLSKGFYLVKVTTQDETFIRKIVKE